MFRSYSSEARKTKESVVLCQLTTARLAWLKASIKKKVPALSVVLMLAGCSSLETRTDAEVSYTSYLNNYQLNAPGMSMLRDAWPLERTEKSFRRVVKSLTPLALPVEIAQKEQSFPLLQQQSYHWVKAMAAAAARAGKVNSSVQAHYAMLVWLGHGENSRLTHEQREARALELLRQIPKRDLFSDYLTGVIKFQQKPVDALIYLNRAADGGYAPAQALLARLYLGESGVPRNDKKARNMLLRMVNNKQTPVEHKQIACGWLGAMSFYGVGTGINDKAAFHYLKMAEPVPQLQYLQGLMLSEGLGTGIDRKAAIQIFTRAAAAGSPSAANQLALNYLNGQGVRSAPRKAGELLMQAVEAGSLAATYNLGLDHLYGNSEPASIAEAVFWFDRAADQGSLPAQRSLNYLMLEGQHWYDFSREETEQVRTELHRAAEQGDIWSSYAIGLLTLRGQGGVADIQTGYAWLNIAVALGYGAAAELRDAAALQMTRPELERAQSLSQSLFDRIDHSPGPQQGAVQL